MRSSMRSPCIPTTRGGSKSYCNVLRRLRNAMTEPYVRACLQFRYKWRYVGNCVNEGRNKCFDWQLEIFDRHEDNVWSKLWLREIIDKHIGSRVIRINNAKNSTPLPCCTNLKRLCERNCVYIDIHACKDLNINCLFIQIDNYRFSG